MSKSPSSGALTGKPIPAAELSAYERWELPQMQDSHAPGRLSRTEQKPVFKPPTAEDLERIHKEAWDEGFEQGYQSGVVSGQEQGRREGLELGRAEGLKKGLAEAKAQVDQQITAMGKLMQSLLDPIATRQELVEAAMVNLAMSVARSVIYRELALNHDLMRELVQQAFALLPRKAKDVVIRINGADSKYIADALKAQALTADIRVDASISAGGILVETSNQLFDFTLEKRFQKSVHAMLYELSQPMPRAALPQDDDSLASLSDFPVELLAQTEQELAQKDATSTSVEPVEPVEPAEPIEPVEPAEPASDVFPKADP